MDKEQEIEFAKRIVNDANHTFLNKEDIISNFEENNILVNDSKNIGFVSHLEYDSINNRGILTYDGERSLKDQQKILLLNYCVLMLNKESNIKCYYKDIPSKSSLKRLGRNIVDASVDKEVGGNSFSDNVKEGIKK